MVNKEEIINIAKLSKLFIDDSQIDDLTSEMDNIIKFAKEVQNIEVDKKDNFDNINGIENALRDDVINNSYAQETVLKNANDVKNGYFCIRKSK